MAVSDVTVLCRCQSTVAVANSVRELEALMQDIPDYSLQFIQCICDILMKYREDCQVTYQCK